MMLKIRIIHLNAENAEKNAENADLTSATYA